MEMNLGPEKKKAQTMPNAPVFTLALVLAVVSASLVFNSISLSPERQTNMSAVTEEGAHLCVVRRDTHGDVFPQ